VLTPCAHSSRFFTRSLPCAYLCLHYRKTPTSGLPVRFPSLRHKLSVCMARFLSSLRCCSLPPHCGDTPLRSWFCSVTQLWTPALQWCGATRCFGSCFFLFVSCLFLTLGQSHSNNSSCFLPWSLESYKVHVFG